MGNHGTRRRRSDQRAIGRNAVREWSLSDEVSREQYAAARSMPGDNGEIALDVSGKLVAPGSECGEKELSRSSVRISDATPKPSAKIWDIVERRIGRDDPVLTHGERWSDPAKLVGVPLVPA